MPGIGGVSSAVLSANVVLSVSLKFGLVDHTNCVAVPKLVQESRLLGVGPHRAMSASA